MGRLRELINDYVHAVPHLSDLFEDREDGRYQVKGNISIEVKSDDDVLDCAVCDISAGGVKVVTRDPNIEDATGVAVKTEEFSAEFPCEALSRGAHEYLLRFMAMDDRQYDQLDYVLTHYTETPDYACFAEML